MKIMDAGNWPNSQGHSCWRCLACGNDASVNEKTSHLFCFKQKDQAIINYRTQGLKKWWIRDIYKRISNVNISEVYPGINGED
jgi:hypothetical protein